MAESHDTRVVCYAVLFRLPVIVDILKLSSAKTAATESMEESAQNELRMFLIPCSCGASFAVADDYDRRGMHIRSFIPCPKCGKRHDPRNRLLKLDYQNERFWKICGC